MHLLPWHNPSYPKEWDFFLCEDDRKDWLKITNHLHDVCIRFSNNGKKGWSPNINGGEITSEYFVCTCILIYILLQFRQIMQKKKKKEKRKLRSLRCFWRTPNTLGKIYLSYCTLKFHSNIFISLKMWGQTFSLAVQVHVKMGVNYISY